MAGGFYPLGLAQPFPEPGASFYSFMIVQDTYQAPQLPLFTSRTRTPPPPLTPSVPATASVTLSSPGRPERPSRCYCPVFLTATILLGWLACVLSLCWKTRHERGA